jgi:hypothetical protein
MRNRVWSSQLVMSASSKSFSCKADHETDDVHTSSGSGCWPEGKHVRHNNNGWSGESDLLSNHLTNSSLEGSLRELLCMSL